MRFMTCFHPLVSSKCLPPHLLVSARLWRSQRRMSVHHMQGMTVEVISREVKKKERNWKEHFNTQPCCKAGTLRCGVRLHGQIVHHVTSCFFSNYNRTTPELKQHMSMSVSSPGGQGSGVIPTHAHVWAQRTSPASILSVMYCFSAHVCTRVCV